MNEINGFIHFLTEKKIELQCSEGQLKISAPKNVLTNEIISEIQKNKAKLIELLVSIESKDHRPLIQKIEKQEGIYKTTYSQKAQWAKYNFSSFWIAENGCLIKIFKEINLDLFKQALWLFVFRHDCLTSHYEFTDGDLVQVTQAQNLRTPALRVLKLSNVADISSSSKEIYHKELNTSFDLNKGPLFRVTVASFNEENHHVFYTIDSSIYDRMSEHIIISEIDEIYECLKNRKHINLPEINFQYHEFSEWEDTLLKGKYGNILRNYWKKYVSSFREVTYLPTDFPYDYRKSNSMNYLDAFEFEIKNFCKPTAIEKFEYISGTRSSFKFVSGGLFKFTFSDQNIILQLRDFSKENAISMYSIFLSVFYLLFHKLSNQKEIVIGNCVSLKDDPKLNQTIGFFTNIIFTKAEVDEKEEYLYFVKRVMNDFINCYEHKNYPWEKVLEESNNAYHKLSLLFLDYLNLGERESEEDNGRLEHEEGAPAIFDNSCFIHEYRNAIQFQWIYSKQLFHEETVKNFIEEYKKILFTVVNNPQSTIKNILQ